MALETAIMMNKIIEEQANSTDWPGRKFTRLWEGIQLDEKPDDDAAEFELDEELRKITLLRKNDPKELLAKISAAEIKTGITCTDKKKMAVVLRARKKDYSQVMTVTKTITKHVQKRDPTPREMVVVMYINGCGYVQVMAASRKQRKRAQES